MAKIPPTSAPEPPEGPLETVERLRRLAANWRLGHYEGDLSVAWDEAAVALLAVLENPNITHYEIGLDHAVTVRHDPVPTIERVKHSGPHAKFCVLCLSGEHERVDEGAVG